MSGFLFQEKFHASIFHQVAVFLNPLQRSMLVLSETERQHVLEYINDELDQLPLRLSTPCDDSPVEQPAKRMRMTDEFNDELGETTPTNTNEVAEYQAMKVTSCPDILEWWKLQSTTFPGLSVLAKRYLSIMASSAASERNFSVAGLVVNEKRSCLSTDNVNDILLINSSMK